MLIRTSRPTREETRLRILQKADELFRQYGFGKTTVADIAVELGMSTANIYKFFPSKNAIVQSCAERNLATIKGELTKIVNSPAGAMERIENCVLSVFSFHEELFQNERQIFKLVVTAVEENWNCMQEYDRFMLDTLTLLVGVGVGRGEFRPAEPGETAQSLLDCLNLALHPHLRHVNRPANGEERVRAQLRFLEKALK